MTADDSTHVNIETGNRIPIGGYLFSETGSSFISAVDWDISSKFGMQTDVYTVLNKRRH